MDALSRRRFLLLSGVAGAGALAAGATSLSWSDLGHAAATRPRNPGSGVLVVVTLYGGNDGLNMVAPVGVGAYHDARPSLALAPAETAPLGDGLALNAAMKGLKTAFDDKQLAVVLGVGYPSPSHSHFQSMDIWQTASPNGPADSGWLGRWLDATGRDPLRALAMDTTLPPLLAGRSSAGATVPAGPLRLPSAPFTNALWQMGARPPTTPITTADETRQSMLDLRTVAAKVDAALPGTHAGATGARGNALASQLSTAARLIAAGLPTRVYAASLGGFDTHSNEKATSTRLLGELDGALASFRADLAKTPHGKDVTVLVYSEFGRRVGANASQGTDHGTANPVLVLGEGVRGALVGQQPSLTDLDDGDLKAHTDFRAVYATLLEGVLGADSAQILGTPVAQMPRLPLLV